MSALGVVIGGIVAVGPDAWGAHSVSLGFAALAAAAFTAAGNALNDIKDRETDRINHPDRPLPSGRVSLASAKLLEGTMFVAAGILGIAASPLCGLVVVVNGFLMFAYEYLVKARGVPGNLLIAYLVGSLFLFAGFAVFREDVVPMVRTGFLTLLAFLATFGREIVKDIEDMAGDVDRRTLPQRVGSRPAGLVASTAFVAAVGLSIVPWWIRALGFPYLGVVLLADGIFIYAALHSTSNPARSQRFAKYAMVVALAAFLVGGILP